MELSHVSQAPTLSMAVSTVNLIASAAARDLR